MSNIRERLLRRFRNKDYRHSYVDSFLDSLVSAQIRALRDRTGMSQQELAAMIGTTQPGVSRFESPDYSSWRIETLRRIARAFDVCLSVRFVSFGDAIDDIVQFGDDKLLRPSFADDPVFAEPTKDRPTGGVGRREVVPMEPYRIRADSAATTRHSPFEREPQSHPTEFTDICAAR